MEQTPTRKKFAMKSYHIYSPGKELCKSNSPLIPINPLRLQGKWSHLLHSIRALFPCPLFLFAKLMIPYQDICLICCIGMSKRNIKKGRHPLLDVFLFYGFSQSRMKRLKQRAALLKGYCTQNTYP